MPFEDALSIIKEDMLEIREHKQEFTSISELGQIETLLATLESKLPAFKQILPKLDSLFGTAVISDVTSLRDTLDELQSDQKEIVHSITNQFLYKEARLCY